MREVSYNIKDYRRAFEFHMHPPFLMGYFFTRAYLNTEPFYFCQDSWFSSYISHRAIEKTSQEGIEIYSNKKKFEALIKQYDEYQKDSTSFFESCLKKDVLTKEETERFMFWNMEYWNTFQRTEFIYLDAAYEYSKNHKETKENLKLFGDFKYRAREYGNLIWYTGPKYFENILKILCKQFNLSYEIVSNCSPEQLLELFENNVPSEEDVTNKNDSYACYKRGEDLVFVTGKESRELVTDFLKGKEEEDYNVLKGVVACKGKVTGKARLLITESWTDFDNLVQKIYSVQAGEIIVAETTTPEFTPAMSKAAAIVTAQGGLMSHAAIISRELKIPCIVNVNGITKVLKDGDMIEVDAEKGIVTILK